MTATESLCRRKAKKKDGEEEFFNMTYLSNLLPHPQKNKLIELQAAHSGKYQEELYKKVKNLNKPFYEWNEWIKQQHTFTLAEYKERKRRRLIDIGRMAGEKLFRSYR